MNEGMNSPNPAVHCSNTQLWRVQLYQRVQSHQVPEGEESFTHRIHLLEGRSRVWLCPLKGTQADTAKIYFYRLPSKRWVEGDRTRTHIFLPCPPSVPQRGIWDLLLSCFFAQGKPKLKGKLKAHFYSSPTMVNLSLLYIKKAHIYLAKISQSQSFLFNIRTI